MAAAPSPWATAALVLVLKGRGLGLTLLGHGSMLLGAFADMGTSLLVIGNGLLLRT